MPPPTLLTFGFIVNKSIALAVSSLISRSVGGVFSGLSIGVIFSLLRVETEVTSVPGKTRVVLAGGLDDLLDGKGKHRHRLVCL
jgi:hypothetical protein